jgi:hypothetical protein
MEIGFDISPVLKTMLPFSLRKIFVSIDIVHCESIKDKEPPFNNIDFECNALIIDSSKQIRISTKFCKERIIDDSIISKLQYMLEIIDGIYHKKTKAVANIIDYNRLIKMINKGYTLTGRDSIFELKKNTDNEDICLMCMDKIKDNNKINRTCCVASYHTNCLNGMITNNNFNKSCPMCRDSFTYDEIHENEMLWSFL